MIIRYAAAAVAATFVTLGIFYLMHVLVLVAEPRLGRDHTEPRIDFVRLRREAEPELRRRRLPERRELEEPPSPPRLDLPKALGPRDQGASAGVPLARIPVDLSGGLDLEISASSNEAVPIVRVAPLYPERARERGIEGWVVVEFTISTTGAVKDAVVIDSDPKHIFERESLRAVQKFKYRPKIVDGVPVEQPGQRISFNFTLEGEKDGE